MKRKSPRELKESSDEEDIDPGADESCSDGTSTFSQQDREASTRRVYDNPAEISLMFC